VNIVIVMGVSGSGKSSIGRQLAARLGGSFLEGDDYHPAANVAKMASGKPLDDADRWPWLARVAEGILRLRREGMVVAACSALKRSYRDRLRLLLEEPVCFVCLNPERSVLEERLHRRPGHFMPPSLLDSQLQTLELPQSDETALIVTDDGPPTALVETAVSGLGNVDAKPPPPLRSR
jgi:carbohydrate kinase (thermoresistant glucokinase family)